MTSARAKRLVGPRPGWPPEYLVEPGGMDTSEETEARVADRLRQDGKDDSEIAEVLRARRIGNLRVVDLRAEDLVWLSFVGVPHLIREAVREVVREELDRVGLAKGSK